jgi:dynein light intermediate chain 1
MTLSESTSVRTLTDNTAQPSLTDHDSFDNIWSQILQDVQDSTKAAPPKSLILLGDNESGRTTLISRLKGVENVRKGIGLEYHYIEIRDEDRDGN